MQHQITQTGLLHTKEGTLAQPGWATKPWLQYKRNAVKAAKWRIKEWDYYCILNQKGGLALTIADNAYLGFVAATWFDFEKPSETSKSIMLPFTMGALSMPESSENGDIFFNKKGFNASIKLENNVRRLQIHIENFAEGKSLHAEIQLKQNPDADSMVIATPFDGDPKAFYYNQKVNCMPASGKATWGAKEIIFNPADAMGVLDWGRGVWTYSNTWYWGSASGWLGGVPFGFNIGYGFGNTSAATENMLFYNNKAHKLDQVSFHIPADSFLKKWKFSSNDGRFEMDFEPILDRASNTNVLLIQSDQHQVFGRFTGKAVLDDGTVLEVKDFLGFAEKVKNRW